MSFSKVFILLVMPLLASTSYAQWAVYDDEVKRQLILVNRTKNIEGLSSGKTYDHFESERTEAGDIKMGSGSDAAVLKGLDTKFENVTVLSGCDSVQGRDIWARHHSCC